MAKKSFKNGINNLFKESLEDIHQLTSSQELEKINIENLSDEEVKWLLLQLKKYDKELHLWRTGKLTVEKFHQSLKDHNLKYNSDTNTFELLKS